MSLPPLPGMGATTKAENYDKITAWANAVGALALNALPIKGALGGTHLDTLTGPTHVGIYQQNSSANTVDKGYPEQTACSVEILPVGLSSGVIQRVTTSTAVPRVYVRRYEGSAFTGWQFLPSLRVEETVGRAFYTYDHINKREQRIYGDTGWRDISPLLMNGWAATDIRILRDGRRVTVKARGLSGALATDKSIITVPSGFAIVAGGTETGFVPDGAEKPVAWRSSLTLEIPAYSTFANTRWVTFEWITNDNWPTTPPGTAIGTIPNN